MNASLPFIRIETAYLSDKRNVQLASDIWNFVCDLRANVSMSDDKCGELLIRDAF